MMQYRKIYYAFSGLLIAASLLSLLFFGLQLGIDFRGGSLMELTFHADSEGKVYIPTKQAVASALSDLELGTVQVQETADNAFFLRFNDVDEATHQEILKRIENLATPPKDGAAEQEGGTGEEELPTTKLSEDGTLEVELGAEEFERITGQKATVTGPVREERFESIGPVIGRETVRKSLQAIALVVVLIVIYIAWVFRKVSYPIGSVKYGFVAIVTLGHDVFITIGAFSLISHFTGAEAGVPFIAALLTILGYSVNDTIVIFDRIRENLLKSNTKSSFEEIISKSVRESLVRSLNSSFTTLFVLVAILFFGGATLQDFVLTLIIGIAIGTYSSIAVASPLLISWSRLRLRYR